MVNPAIAVCFSVLYETSSPSLNLWKVENPIVLLVRLTKPAVSIESNSTEWFTKTKLGDAIQPDPFPPLTFKVGVVI